MVTCLVLEKCLEELDVLKKLIPSLYPEPSAEEALNPHTVWECLDLFPGYFDSTNSQATEIRNIHCGRLYLEESLRRIVNELKSENTYNSLTEIIQKEKERKSRRVQLSLKLESDKLKISSLKKQLINLQTTHKKDMEEAEATIVHLIKLKQKTKINNIATARYVDQQEKSRMQMAVKRLRDDHVQFKDELKKLESTVANEKRTNEDVESFVTQQYDRIQQIFKVWSAKYDEDTKEIDRKIRELSAERELHLEIYRSLHAKCEKCKEVLKEDHDAKEAHRRQIELEAKRKYSCLIIQTWWRAVMVRRFLGEFKYIKKLMKRRKTKAKISKRKN